MNRSNVYYMPSANANANTNVEDDDMYGHFLDIEQQTTITHRIIIRNYKGEYVVSQTDLASIQSEPMRMFRNIVPVEPPKMEDHSSSGDYKSKTHIYEDKYVFVVSKLNVLRYTAVCLVSALFGCASAVLAATATTDLSDK